MKIIDRFINFIFSLFVLVLAATVALMAAGIFDYNYVSGEIGNLLFSDDNRTITCIVSIVVFLLSLKTTVFRSSLNRQKKGVIYVDTNNGKVQIAQETIETTAKNAVTQYDCVKDAKARMIKAKKGVDLYMLLYVYHNTNLMDLTTKAQDDVKTAVEGTTGVRVNNVDIQIKNTSDGKNTKNKNKAPKEEVPEKKGEEVPIFNTDLIPEPERPQGQLTEVRPPVQEEGQEAKPLVEVKPLPEENVPNNENHD